MNTTTLDIPRLNRPAMAAINTAPVYVIRFAKDDGNDAHEFLRFESALAFKAWAPTQIGALRIIETKDDLKDVPTPVLLAIFNRTRADKPLDRFRDRETAENRVFEVAFKDGVATPSNESLMAKAEAATQTEAKTKAEAEAQQRKADREAKKAEKAAEKEKAAKDREAKRADGVIGTIKTILESDRGGTVDEIMTTLTAKFPDRSPDGMKSTVKIQTSRLAKSTKRTIVNEVIKGRGRVYKFEDKGAIPGEREVAVAEAPAEDATGEAKGKKGGKGKKGEIAGSIEPAAQS